MGLGSSADPFNSNDNFSNEIVLLGNSGNARIDFNGTTTTAAFSSNSTVVVLGKIEIDVSGNNDKLSLWMDPNLTGGESGLGAPLLTDDGADAFGSGLSAIDVGLRGGGQFDALRISNDADNGFHFVTTGVIPEPASVVLVGLGGMILLGRRRRHA